VPDAFGVLYPLASAVLASLLTWGANRASGSRGEVKADDRTVSNLNEDLRRWVRDRNRALITEQALTAQEHAGRGAAFSSIHLAALAEAQRTALREYRDEATRKRREYEDVLARECWLHRLWRSRKGDPLGRLKLPADGREALARWRAPVRFAGFDGEVQVDDPTRSELEPGLAELERDG
jgi:hypothetical protein